MESTRKNDFKIKEQKDRPHRPHRPQGCYDLNYIQHIFIEGADDTF